jgi:hypothetical protein
MNTTIAIAAISNSMGQCEKKNLNLLRVLSDYQHRKARGTG